MSRSGQRVRMPTNTSFYASNPAFCTKNEMVPTTGLEPINGLFSPLPMIASGCVFIALQYTRTSNDCKHYMCIFGKRREENRVQTVCKKTDCANFVQTKLAPESVQTCAKILACRGAWLACGASRPPSGRSTAHPVTQTCLRPKAAANAIPATNASGEPDAPAKDRLR